MRLRSTLILASVLAACACDRPPSSDDDAGPGVDSGPCTPAAEDTAAACMDMVDNDCDGNADCEDNGCCSTGVTCGATTACGMCSSTGPENTATACADGMDNDCDGFRDCSDRDCTAICGVENSNPACTDGVDNNMNSFIDCMDFDCEDRIVCRGEASNATCSDGMDNDGEGGTDCADEDCQDEAIVVCNGAVAASPLPAAAEWPALVATRCTNGTSDDGDDRIDCGEFSCLWNHAACEQPPAERGNAACSDEADNDLDGLTDCDDPACLAEGTVVCRTAVVPPEDQWPTLSNTECMNSVNDDATEETERIDCADFDCSQNPDVTVCPGENTNARCMDEMDNDDNGFADCEDFSCSMNPNVTVCERERSFDECSNGMDDDGNNFIDCADFSCAPPEGSGTPSPACF